MCFDGLPDLMPFDPGLEPVEKEVAVVIAHGDAGDGIDPFLDGEGIVDQGFVRAAVIEGDVVGRKLGFAELDPDLEGVIPPADETAGPFARRRQKLNG